ncbi:hypothetical protein OPIT5_18785 [Opitutaceae bacterium TAV5]|nr:hypothetical protein OPIT5_18785 [Opitutaceae bacterium TAV5]
MEVWYLRDKPLPGDGSGDQQALPVTGFPVESF